jgi:hypothetical protein
MSQYIVFITRIMSYKRLNQTLSKIQQRIDPITPQTIDCDIRSPRTPHRKISNLLQILSSSLARLRTIMIDTQQV